MFDKPKQAMRGLSEIPTRTFGLGLGVVIFDALAAACIIFCTTLICIKRWNLETRARTLQIGMIVLSLWCILNFIELDIRQARARVTYSYILVDCFYSILRVVSDIFVIWGVCKLMLRRIQLRYGDANDVFRAIAVLLWILGIYHVCLKFAVALSWLSFADPQVIENLAHSRNAFEIAFQALQVILYLTNGFFHLAIKELEDFLFMGCLLLGIRSFCEVIIVGQLDRYPVKLQDILRARSVMYHLCSAGFAIATTIDLLNPKNDEDTFLRRETEAINLVKDSVIKKVSEATLGGSITAPELTEVLDQVEKKNVKNAYATAEVRRLRKSFKDWQPIDRWDGSTSERENVGSTPGGATLHPPTPPSPKREGPKRRFLDNFLKPPGNQNNKAKVRT